MNDSHGVPTFPLPMRDRHIFFAGPLTPVLFAVKQNGRCAWITKSNTRLQIPTLPMSSTLTNEPWENKKAQPGKRPNCAFKMFSTKEISGSNYLIGGSTLFGPHRPPKGDRPDTPRHLRSGQVCTEREYSVSFGKNAEIVFVEPADAMPLAQIMYDLPWFGEA